MASSRDSARLGCKKKLIDFADLIFDKGKIEGNVARSIVADPKDGFKSSSVVTVGTVRAIIEEFKTNGTFLKKVGDAYKLTGADGPRHSTYGTLLCLTTLEVFLNRIHPKADVRLCFHRNAKNNNKAGWPCGKFLKMNELSAKQDTSTTNPTAPVDLEAKCEKLSKERDTCIIIIMGLGAALLSALVGMWFCRSPPQRRRRRRPRNNERPEEPRNSAIPDIEAPPARAEEPAVALQKVEKKPSPWSFVKNKKSFLAKTCKIGIKPRQADIAYKVFEQLRSNDDEKSQRDERSQRR